MVAIHSLMAIDNHEQLTGHNKLGASWEGFALEESLLGRTRWKVECLLEIFQK